MSVYPGTDFKHGASAYDIHHCRCKICVSDKNRIGANRRKRLKGTEPPAHGTIQGYSVYGCRCEKCVSARKAFMIQYKEKKVGKEPLKHGLTGYSVYGCRCDICVSARKKSDQKRKNNSVIRIRERERGWSRLGIVNFTYEQFCFMYDKQGGKCSICGVDILKESKKKSDVANVDHDHLTGVVRSLLCHNCNKMIGCGRESRILISGAEYLKKHGGI